MISSNLQPTASSLFLEVTVYNTRDGRYDGFAFVSAHKPASGGRPDKHYQCGRLDLQQSCASLAEAKEAAAFTAELLGAQIVTFKWSEREWSDGAGEGFEIVRVHRLL